MISELLEDINFNELFDNLSSKEMIGNPRKAKRVYRRNNKRKYYFINKFEYTPGILDYIPGGKEMLMLSLELINERITKNNKIKI